MTQRFLSCFAGIAAIGLILATAQDANARHASRGSYGSHGGFGGVFFGSHGSHGGSFGGLFQHNHGSNGGHGSYSDDCDCGCGCSESADTESQVEDEVQHQWPDREARVIQEGSPAVRREAPVPYRDADRSNMRERNSARRGVSVLERGAGDAAKPAEINDNPNARNSENAKGDLQGDERDVKTDRKSKESQ